jgi:mannosyl-oligosaccharide alpha-1,2-mannosidase
MAWHMFQSIKKATETELAFSAIADVTVDGSETEKTDSMEVCNIKKLDTRFFTDVLMAELLVIRDLEILLPYLFAA